MHKCFSFTSDKNGRHFSKRQRTVKLRLVWSYIYADVVLNKSSIFDDVIPSRGYITTNVPIDDNL